jgi:hypothetical protein
MNDSVLQGLWPAKGLIPQTLRFQFVDCASQLAP